MKRNGTAGHLCALLTVIIWGTTFISIYKAIIYYLEFPFSLQSCIIPLERTQEVIYGF